MERNIKIMTGDCLQIMKTLKNESIDLIYLDPPFFTQRIQKLKTRDRLKEFSYHDLWETHKEYSEFIYERVKEMHRLLARHGSLFFHCDRNASHIIRVILDDIFGQNQFRSEIIWSYKRWSNSKKGLLPAHQTIYFYSKSDEFTFHTIYQEYSATTNIDQILQKRVRDKHGKSVYARTDDGAVVVSDVKKGVPLSDVWEIPYLNPKAKERVGYPTQKPVLLLERILSISSNPNDTVLDPFCGSGTTLVVAKLLERNAIGIDLSEEATNLSQRRVQQPIRTESALLLRGKAAYHNLESKILHILEGVDYIPVQRNKGIDGILREQFHGSPIPIRVQRSHETLHETALLLWNAAKKKMARKAILIQTHDHSSLFPELKHIPKDVLIVPSTACSIKEKMNALLSCGEHNNFQPIKAQSGSSTNQV